MRTVRPYFTTKLLSFMAGALFVLWATPVTAQTDSRQMQQRLNQLENQVQTLSRAVFRGEKPLKAPDLSFTAEQQNISAFEDRLSGLEARQRELTGQIEKALFDIQQIRNEMQRGAVSPAAVTPSFPAAPAPILKPLVGISGVAPVELASDEKETSPTTRTPADLYDSAFADVRAARYLEAEAKLSDFMSKHADHPLAANAQYWLGETYYVREKFADAAKTFAQGYQNYPKSSKAADSLLKLALSLDKLGKKQDACLTFAQLAKEYPGERTPATRKAAQESKRLGC